MILKILATCHTTRKINDEFEGDEIDKEIFIFSKHKLVENKSKDAIITIESEEGNVLEILKVNQFESRFQSMSVLVRDVSAKKIFAFIKGAPEKIYKNSVNKPN